MDSCLSSLNEQLRYPTLRHHLHCVAVSVPVGYSIRASPIKKGIPGIAAQGPQGQGNRVLTKEHLEEVVLDPTGFKPFTLDTPFESGFLLQHIEGNLA